MCSCLPWKYKIICNHFNCPNLIVNSFFNIRIGKGSGNWVYTSRLYIFKFVYLFIYLFYYFVFLKIYLFERVYLHIRAGGGSRGRGRESQADFALSAEPDTGLDLMTLRSQPEPKTKCQTLNRLHHPGTVVGSWVCCLISLNTDFPICLVVILATKSYCVSTVVSINTELHRQNI